MHRQRLFYSVDCCVVVEKSLGNMGRLTDACFF